MTVGPRFQSTPGYYWVTVQFVIIIHNHIDINYLLLDFDSNMVILTEYTPFNYYQSMFN